LIQYSPEEYFKKLYPDWFKETPFSEAIFYVFLFFLLMLAFYLYIRFFENKRRVKMLINNIRHEIGDEIDFGSIHRRGRDNYGVMIRKISDAEWIAYKFPFGTKEKVPLRRGSGLPEQKFWL